MNIRLSNIGFILNLLYRYIYKIYIHTLHFSFSNSTNKGEIRNRALYDQTEVAELFFLEDDKFGYMIYWQIPNIINSTIKMILMNGSAKCVLTP